MPDGSLDTSRAALHFDLLAPSRESLIRQVGDDAANTGFSLFHVAQIEMQALGYGQEEIAEFLNEPDNLRFVIEFCEATGDRIQEALATELAFD